MARLLAAVGLGLVLAAGCGRTAENQAAVHAQEACIFALGPVAKDRRPSPAALRSARRSADSAARGDERWLELPQRIEDFETASEGPTGEASLDALVRECERVNRIVKEKRDDI